MASESRANPFGGGDQAEVLDRPDAGLAEQLAGADGRAAGGEHRVENQGEAGVGGPGKTRL